MGKTFTKVKSPMRDFNLESRVHKVLEREKPTPAPRHPLPERLQQQQQHNEQANNETTLAPTAEMIRKMAMEEPDEANASEVLRKNEPLLDRMGQLNIRTEGTNPDMRTPTRRKMPEDRRAVSFAHVEPAKMPLGRISVRQVVETLVDHSRDPEEWSASKVAQVYKLDAEKSENVLKYYSAFDIYIPKKASRDGKIHVISGQNYEDSKKLMLDGK